MHLDRTMRLIASSVLASSLAAIGCTNPSATSEPTTAPAVEEAVVAMGVSHYVISESDGEVAASLRDEAGVELGTIGFRAESQAESALTLTWDGTHYAWTGSSAPAAGDEALLQFASVAAKEVAGALGLPDDQVAG